MDDPQPQQVASIGIERGVEPVHLCGAGNRLFPQGKKGRCTLLAVDQKVKLPFAEGGVRSRAFDCDHAGQTIMG